MSSATGELRYYGPSSALAFTTTISSVLRSVRLQGPGMTLSNVRNEAWRNLPRPIPAPLPDQIFGGLLADAYFAHVHPQYPFLHRPTFDFWESSVHTSSASNNPPDTTQAYFVYMVSTVAAISWVPLLNFAGLCHWCFGISRSESEFGRGTTIPSVLIGIMLMTTTI